MVWRVEDWIADPVPDDAIVWRYLSYAKFQDVVDTAEIYLPRIDLQEDDAEGRWPDGVEHLMFTGGGDPATMSRSIEAVRRETFATCWTRRPDPCHRMWREYRAEDGAALRMRYGDLLAAVKDAEVNVAAGGVIYCDVIDSEWVHRYHRANTLVLPFQKRTKFSWEQEVRLVYQAPDTLLDGIRVSFRALQLDIGVLPAPHSDRPSILELTRVLRASIWDPSQGP